METLKFKLTGVSPLLMHNGRLADPLDYYARKIKEISAKRHKTDADYEEIARLEWYGGLYLRNEQPCIPGYVMEATLIGKGGAARKMKMGKQAAVGLIVDVDSVLDYDGPADLTELHSDDRFHLRVPAKVGQSSVMRTRPKFDNWEAEVEILYLPEILNRDMIIQWMDVAGTQVGLMDWRPKFGRFTAELLNGA